MRQVSSMRALSPALAALALLNAGCATQLDFAIPERPAEQVSAPVANVNAVQAASTAVARWGNAPVGEIVPPPAGSLSMTFYAPGDLSPVVRMSSGRIGHVLRPSGREEPLLAYMDYDRAETLVYRIDNSLRTNDLYDLAHIPAYQAENMMPGTEAWEYLVQFMRPGDQIWSFGDVECGIVVLREDQVFCVIVRSRADVPPRP
jgi:hypothetical protein